MARRTALILLATAVIGLSACGSGGTSQSSGTTSTPAETPPSANDSDPAILVIRNNYVHAIEPAGVALGTFDAQSPGSGTALVEAVIPVVGALEQCQAQLAAHTWPSWVQQEISTLEVKTRLLLSDFRAALSPSGQLPGSTALDERNWRDAKDNASEIMGVTF